MKTATLDRDIRDRIDSFVNDLSNVVKIAALESVRDALGAQLGDGRAVRAPRRAPAGRTPKLIVKRRGGKRSAEAVAQASETVLAYVKANDGQRLEEISRGLGVSTADLKLPVSKLVAAKQLKTKGKKRGMRYFLR